MFSVTTKTLNLEHFYAQTKYLLNNGYMDASYIKI